MASPAGIEPTSKPQEGLVLSIKLWGPNAQGVLLYGVRENTKPFVNEVQRYEKNVSVIDVKVMSPWPGFLMHIKSPRRYEGFGYGQRIFKYQSVPLVS